MTRRTTTRGNGPRWSAAFVAGLVIAACSRAPSASDSDCWCKDSGPLVSPALVAFLSRARSSHHIADQHEKRDDVAGAVQELEALLRAPRPGRAQAPVEVREVLADTHARLADLMSRQHKHDRAAAQVREGLKFAPETSYFRGHLFEVLGIVEERRSAALAAAGQTAEAEQARQRAIAALEEAVEIQDTVIRSAIVNSQGP